MSRYVTDPTDPTAPTIDVVCTVYILPFARQQFRIFNFMKLPANNTFPISLQLEKVRFRHRLPSTSQPSAPRKMSLPMNVSKDHHIGNPPTKFKNPWPSFDKPKGFWDVFGMRFGSNRNFVPVPEDREGLVKFRKPTWGNDNDNRSKLKATWIGHASWLLEFPSSSTSSGQNVASASKRGVTVLLDPVFADRTSPFTWFGPKRYSPLTCSIADLPEVDIVAISHNHYDHLDYDAIMELHRKSARTHFFCPLRNKAWFVDSGIPEHLVHELDWWEAAAVSVEGIGNATVICTPAQHSSSRTGVDRDKMLWSSWAVGETSVKAASEPADKQHTVTVEKTSGSRLDLSGYRVWFAGDTGYRTVESATPTEEEEASKPRCPAFKEVGEYLGPFDLALVPIGLYSPRSFMSNVHCCPEDSVCMLQDVQAKRTIGMHYGTFRGGLSSQYEDVREPPVRFAAACKKAGLKWDEEVGLCDIGETVVVERA